MLTRGLSTTAEKDKDYTVLKEGKLFKKVLVANRGEIALRIIRACRELGIKTVVIYSKPDKDSLAVRFADKAFCIGPAESNKSYLDINKIIKIAKKARVDAIHPGYGFLAENSEFARLCQKKKIKFIGPSAKTIRVMGDKSKARETMINVNVPVISGTKNLRNEEHALEVAEKIGYPIIIKASAGGGGKGMRIVKKRRELVRAFKAAQAEAEAVFGDKTLYIEKYLEDPRHIEFQILSDRYGNIIHLGERECSIQRRHQKLIEEAPSPTINNKLREKMGETAIRAVATVGYEGAGTVEFLLDKNKNFFFMEMNTRIQVEHGITEMITNVDLVKEQIKIASGAKLAYKQEDIKFNGCAIECRINAEDPLNNFEPSPGTITNYLPPGGAGIRVCSSCHTGHIISHYYDPLIAKLMCSGRTRHEAIVRTRRALDEFIIGGVETTIPFHKAVLNNKKFVKGDINTSFIEKNMIIESIKKERKPKKKELSQKEKVLIVTTAVSQYLDKKQNSYVSSNKPSAWAMVGRQESMENSESL
ncbi:acetyl-CoA carboxylase biotin carboxylase subunit [Candidatus Woesearchaeota archaeon]|nr:acetyl-CoA carboxylase biotin carboxylase subunit [Candidatus Woesearchaeota archaeon]